MSDEPKLLPCPFCGSSLVGKWTAGSCVVCHACGAEGPVTDMGSEWNRRVPAPAVPDGEITMAEGIWVHAISREVSTKKPEHWWEWQDYVRADLVHPAPAVPDDVADWRDDPTADERWNAGCDFAMTQLCVVLEVDPKSVSWDAATEELEGDVRSVIGNIITAAFGDDWPTPATIEAQAAELARLREENALMAASLDEEERKHGLSTNGNMWRFWSQQLREYHERRAKERAALTHPTGEPT